MGFWLIFFSMLLSFVFAVVLFYLSKYATMRVDKVKLEGNLLNEFELNELFLKNLLRELEHLEYLSFRNIANNSKPISTPSLANYRRFFVEMYFKKGYLFEKLTPVDINKIDRIMNIMNFEHQDFLNNEIWKWKNGSSNEGGDKRFRDILESEREMVSQFIKDIRAIREKIEKRKGLFQRFF